MTKVLVVVAHPDDETIGMGGTVLRHIDQGHEVFFCCVTDGAGARHNESSLQEKCFLKASRSYGVVRHYLLGLPDQQLDDGPLLNLIKPLEEVFRECRPDIVYTHTDADVNQDHRAVYYATLVCSRPHPTSTVKQLLTFEVPSSTEWWPKIGPAVFCPNRFVDVEKYVEQKIDIFNLYKETFQSEVKPYPHPRSIESLIVIMKERGISVGLQFAEAFCVVREVLR